MSTIATVRKFDWKLVEHLSKVWKRREGRRSKRAKPKEFYFFEKPIGGPPYGWAGPIHY